jgi:hypothetical protein
MHSHFDVYPYRHVTSSCYGFWRGFVKGFVALLAEQAFAVLYQLGPPGANLLKPSWSESGERGKRRKLSLGVYKWKVQRG